MKLRRVLLSAIFCFSAGAQAALSQWSVGAATSYSPAVYLDTDANQTVIPVIGYEGEHLFFRGFMAGYRLRPIGSTHNLVFRVVYDPRTLKPEDSSHADIKLLDEREATILGGFSYQAITQVGMFEATVGSDLGATHNGIYAEAAWRLPIRRDRWSVTPSIGYSYNGERINNHLYGVSDEEAARTGLNAFDADWDGQYFVGLSGYYRLGQHIRVTGGIRYINLQGDIEQSPIIESGVNTTVNIGLAYVF